MRRSLLLLVGLCMAVPLTALPAGEGMWLFTNPPKKLLKEKFNFEKDQAWYDHVMKSSVRFNSGGAGSFVSPDGLVVTNHHVGPDGLGNTSDQKDDVLQEGV